MRHTTSQTLIGRTPGDLSKAMSWQPKSGDRISGEMNEVHSRLSNKVHPKLHERRCTASAIHERQSQMVQQHPPYGEQQHEPQKHPRHQTQLDKLQEYPPMVKDILDEGVEQVDA